MILADEPTGNLHSTQAKEIMDVFQKLNESGTTIIQVTHSEVNAGARPPDYPRSSTAGSPTSSQSAAIYAMLNGQCRFTPRRFSSPVHFLLFQVQPLLAKLVLPWFGGSAAVWSAALLFFQLFLLAGYLYAHCLIRYLTPKQQFWTHSPLLIASLATLPIIPSATWKPSGGDDPTLRILLLLVATIGLPYGLLAATSPLLQAWYLRTSQGAIPYRLFALSNLGSMLALLSLPLVVEPRLRLSTQAILWSFGYGAFAIACVFAAWRSLGSPHHAESPVTVFASPPGFAQRILWIGFAACASILLLAVSSHLTQNVAPIPLLWVVPLSLYLLSFILCFESDRIYRRAVFLPLLVASLLMFTKKGDAWYHTNDDVSKLIPALCAALFVCCMVCHGELARRRRDPRYLTQFYLMVSLGGAIGGLFVALAAPRLFNSYLELPIGMVLCAALDDFRPLEGHPSPASWITADSHPRLRGLPDSKRGPESSVNILLSRPKFLHGVLHGIRDDEPQKNRPPQHIWFPSLSITALN